jgi:hypothetical protein
MWETGNWRLAIHHKREHVGTRWLGTKLAWAATCSSPRRGGVPPSREGSGNQTR